ncbi:MAG: HAMP domain-containing histidine kinase [Polyangiaceae bacterium]|nr:HAMP domain-containing histidine kinase [Myxococcales bacterium]MCB9585621.1 HAMP domain-containing histidine kinase [Polyangiaceae bacterium]MCB9606364.1 HAMP domain-containing histidine kinase [Polyangiaceae bacterium]
MKPGLRLQLLLLLGGLLLLGLLPLYFAVSTYTRVTLQEVRYASARSLGRAVAGHVSEARERRTHAELMELLHSEIGASGLEAIGVYDPQGKAVARVGEPVAVDELPQSVDPGSERVFPARTNYGPGIAVVVPDSHGAVAAVLRTDDDAARVAPLLRLFALYTSVIAFALLLLSYFVLTRWIVRPLDSLGRAASRVAQGARKLELPRSGARELTELGVSLRQMTEHLIAEEEALRKKVDEVERATRELEATQASLVRSERLASVGRLAAGLAHEIGNPIAALIGLEDLLIEGGLDEAEQKDFLLRMRKETERIHNILRDLLQFARPSQQANPDGGDVETAIYDTVTLVTPQKALRDISLEVDVFPELPLVRLSREQLVQVLLNLVLNAADACGPGGRVVVRAEPKPEGVCLSVEDDGPGVSPAVRDQLFEPFVTTKEVGKGTGLGLSVCRGLVEAAGGTIDLDPSYEGGARFVVELPALAND